ncbi:MAG: DUF3450 family protein [Planctomycetota bacterium]|nr:DUF3450 family protein [Planctomycetota bacterium]
MKDKSRLLLGIIALVFVAVTANFARAGSRENARLAKQLRAKLEALHQLRAARLSEHQAHRERLARVDRQIQRLRDDTRSVRTLVDADRALIIKLKAAAKKAESERIGAALLISELSDRALPIAQSTKERIEGGIPFQKGDRLARINAVVDGLKDASPIKKGLAITELFSMAGEELRYARGIEFWNTRLPIGEQKIHAYVMRIGLVNQIYISEDGLQTGVYGPKEKGLWRKTLSDEERVQVLNALRVLQGRQPPEIAPLPFAKGGQK